MTEPPLTDQTSPVVWDQTGLPRSRLFDDVYFSAADGLAESRAVFLQGCDLPQAWRGRSRFVVGELGFGSGLNIVALLELWRRTREPGARLHIFSIEAWPMPAADAARALGAWTQVADLSALLIQRWPGRARGFHRIEFGEVDAVLDLAVMDAADALDAWTGVADAWFLDGFSPAANPGMWSQTVLSAVARRSAPGARAATFTVAGAVRRELSAQGFAVEKRPGFGRKRERLEAVWPGQPPSPPLPIAPQDHDDRFKKFEPDAGGKPLRTFPHPHPHPARVAIIGAGIAGAALARAFRTQGCEPLVIEAEAPGCGASGNPAGLVMPRLDAGGGAVAQLYAQAFGRATALYAAIPGAVIARGAAQAEVGPKDPGRFDRIAPSLLFEPGSVERVAAAALEAAVGEAAGAGGLIFHDAQVVDPSVLLDAWLPVNSTITARVRRLAFEGGVWRLFDPEEREIACAQIVCLAGGLAAKAFAPEAPLTPVRGQVSFAPCAAPPKAVIGGGYLIPTRDGLLFGATHDRDQTDTAVRAEDHLRNLDLLAQIRPALAETWGDKTQDRPLEGRAGVRAATPDFLPLAGAVEGQTGLFILSGLGSRGFCAAPVLADHVAALALGAPSPLPRPLSEIVDPGRFEKRRARTGRPRP